MSEYIVHADPPTEEKKDDEKDKDDKDKDDKKDDEDKEEDSDSGGSSQKDVAGAFNDAAQELGEKTDKEQKEAIKQNTNVGDVWGYMGAKSVFWGMSNMTDYSVSYSTLRNNGSGSGGNATARFMNKARYFAATYGYVLYKTGIDHSISRGDTSNSIGLIGRFLFGGIILVVYLISSLVSTTFEWVVKVLGYFNPLDWIVNGANGASSGGVFQTVAGKVKEIYDAFVSLGMVGAFVCFAGAVVLALVGMRVSDQPGPPMGRGIGIGLFSAFWHLLKRVFTMIALPVVMLTLYSLMIGSIQSSMENSQGGIGTNVPEYAVYTNLVDFKGWVTNSRLQLPSGLKGSFSTSTATGSVPTITHSSVALINSKGAGIDSASPYTNGGTFKDSLSANETHTADDKATNMIMSWMTNDRYSASNYAAAVQNSYIANYAKEDDKPEKILEDLKKALIGKNDKINYNANGHLSANDGQNAKGMTVTFDSTESPEGYKGLSTIGTYNYLGTLFSNTGMSHNDTSKLSGSGYQYEHYSVGLVGRGIVAFGNYIFMLGLMFAGAVLGFGYAYWTVKALIESIPKMFGSFFMGSLGTGKGFGLMITQAFGVLISVGGSVLLYGITSEILIGIGQSFDSTFFTGDAYSGDGFAAIMPVGAIGLNAGASTFAYAAVNSLSGILLLLAAFFLIKIRGPILSLFTEWLDEVIRMLNMTESAAFGGTAGNHAPLNNNALGGVGMDGRNSSVGDNLARGMGNFGAQTAAGGTPGAVSGSPTDGGVTGGSMNRTNRLGNPKGMLGKLRNAQAVYKDQTRARMAKRGAPDSFVDATARDKLGALGKMAGQAAVIAGGKGLDTLIGSNTASDLRGIYNANLDDNMKELGNANEYQSQLEKSANQGINGNSNNNLSVTDSSYGDTDEANAQANDFVDRQAFDKNGNAYDGANAREGYVDDKGRAVSEFVDSQGNAVHSSKVVPDGYGGYQNAMTGEQVAGKLANSIYGNRESGNKYSATDVYQGKDGKTYADKFKNIDVVPKPGTESGSFRDAQGNVYAQDDVIPESVDGRETGRYYARNAEGQSVPVGQVSDTGQYVDSQGNEYDNSQTPISMGDNGRTVAKIADGREEVQDMSYVDDNNQGYSADQVSNGYYDQNGNLTDQANDYVDNDTGQIMSGSLADTAESFEKNDDGSYTAKMKMNPSSLATNSDGSLVQDANGFYQTKDGQKVALSGENADGTFTRVANVSPVANTLASVAKDSSGQTVQQQYRDLRDPSKTYDASDVKANQPYAMVNNNGKRQMALLKQNGDGNFVDAKGRTYGKNQVKHGNFHVNPENGRYTRVAATNNFKTANGNIVGASQVTAQKQVARNSNKDLVTVNRNKTGTFVQNAKANGGYTKVTKDMSAMSRQQKNNFVKQATNRASQIKSQLRDNPSDTKLKQELVNQQALARAAKINQDVRDAPKLGILRTATPTSSLKQASVGDVRNTLNRYAKVRSEAEQMIKTGINPEKNAIKDEMQSLAKQLHSYGVKNSVLKNSSGNIHNTVLMMDAYVNTN
ncbi:hypothetical protein [Ligilactobacillus equi]|uniref:Uncharacterized protein n=1 Tax=Ligilactobacillus equi DSM 15833 = JCM 10991 TaxID=1423740 RepID=A0A0R1TZQ6_9LACO|nr:hypothetical protein [Ligilactobacillus equi]KRL84344.1 hypothetical protein FC36_GL000267 [Ligilactobacillus equi DSM 15833 = JCM 10991]